MDLAMPPMPYSAVFVPTQGQRNAVIPVEMRNSSSSSSTLLALPAGVVQVIVTWRGTEGLHIWHARSGVTERMATIQPTSTAQDRSTGVLTFVSEEASMMSVLGWTDTWSQNTLDNNYVVGVQVMPMGTPADVTGGGSMLRVDNSVGTRVFLGDQMIYGDTGWRTVPTNPDYVVSGFLRLRRIGRQVTAWLTTYVLTPGSGYGFLFNAENPLPPGYRTVSNDRTMGYVGLANNAVLGQRLSAYGTSLTWVGDLHSQGGVRPTQPLQGTFSWFTDDDWPTSLPGTAI